MRADLATEPPAPHGADASSPLSASTRRSPIRGEWGGSSRRWSITLACLGVALAAQVTGTSQSAPATPENNLVRRALAAELAATQDTAHPMRYRLRKSTPRLTTVKEIVETSDGAVAKLISVNDQALTPTDQQRDDARLDSLLADPSRQHKRKQNQVDDTARAVKVLRALPKAFLYSYAGQSDTGTGTIEKFNFQPNPKFDAPDLETSVLTALTGEIWIDPVHERVVRLDGHLADDVDFGWGVLGRLNKGGWIRLEQARVAGDQWRLVHFQMAMTGRVLIRTRVFDTTEDQSSFAPVQPGMTYQEAIRLLRSDASSSDPGR